MYSRKKRIKTSDTELVFLHLLGYAGHVVHCCKSGVQNVDALFFLLRWDRYGFHKNTSVYLTPNLCLCIWWDKRDT
jgi:hypothetical protein